MKIAHLAATRSFAYFQMWQAKVKGGFELQYKEIAGFLTSRGYYIYRNTVNEHIYIRILDNIVKETGKKDMVDDIMNFIRETEAEYIYEFFLKNIGKAVDNAFLMTLPAKDVKFKKDVKHAMQFYYRNCIVKVTKDKVSIHDYSTLKDCIWESQIIDRDFDINAEPESDFRTFIYNITNRQEDRYKSLCSIIGFALHTYKDPGYCPAIILNDEVISDNPEGGTGKGLIVKAIRKFRNMVVINGKGFNPAKSFLYQRVNKETEILTFDDVDKKFDFEALFSIVTDGIPIEKKGLQETYIPFEESPKIIVTTNYALKGAGNSGDRRKEDVEISQHYSKQYTPFHEFGKLLFDDWSEEEFKCFDAFIIQCCQSYLINGIIHQVLVNLPIKKLAAETCDEFIDFMDDFDFRGNRFTRVELYTLFESENPHTKWSPKSIFKFVRTYCKFHGVDFKETKSGAIRSFEFGH